MANWSQGQYTVKNKEKYIGNKIPKYRSSWELAFFRFCDNHPAVVKWASEAIQIPYKNPLTGKQSIYVPDVFVQFRDRDGKFRSELIEIKPMSQTLVENGKKLSEKDRLTIAVNHAKWKSAAQFCRFKNMTFRIVTERDLFRQ